MSPDFSQRYDFIIIIITSDQRQKYKDLGKIHFGIKAL